MLANRNLYIAGSKCIAMEATCKNCETTLQPGFAYCPKCSQKTDLHRISMHEVFHEGVHYFTHADKGLPQLVRDLVLKGGVVAREFVNGKRKKYFSPLNFFLLIAALNLFAINIDATSERPDMAREQAAELDKITDPQQRAAFVKFFERQVAAVDFIKQHSNKTILVTLPLMAFIFWLFYRKGPYNFTEHLIAGMFMYGFCTLIFAVLCILNLLFLVDVNYIYGITLLLQLLYFAQFYYRFMGNTKHLRAYVASFSAILFVFVVTGIAVAVYVMAGM